MASGVTSCCATPDCPSFDGEPSDFVAFNSLNTTEKGWTNCANGLIVPVWGPTKDLTTLDRALRGAIYFAALSYLFIGVSIIADRFMAAIEVITSQEKEVRVKCSDGSRQIIVVRVWNETVANLTLMALGSSAPEIMLSVIEIYAKGFEAGDLGPGTIVGSAAFNLFVIIGVCIMVVPDNEVRRIKHLRVFFITAAWSIFAYVWLYFILTWSSYGEVEVWEALLTFAFFFATVGTAYIADRRLLFCKYLAKDYRLNWRGIIVETEGEGKWQLPKGVKTDEFKWFQEEYEDSHVMREFEEHRQLFIKILKELRQKNRNLSVNALEAKAREEVLKRGPKSRAFYRMQATRKLIGGSNLTKKSFELLHEEDASRRNSEKQEEACQEFEQTLVHFNPGHYTVIENIGTFSVTVRRKGGDLGLTLMVDYQTEDGTAKAGQDYMHSQGTIVFPPGSDCQTFKVSIVDDDIFEEDEHFYIRLSNLRVKRPNGRVECAPSPSQVAAGQQFPAKLDAPALATVMILDNDHSGVFSLSEKDIEIGESVGECKVKVIRSEGARGMVAVPYRTISGTAKPGKDYEEVEGELIFENEETEKTIVVRILEEDSYEKNVLFYVEIDEPRQIESNKEPHLLEQIMQKSPDELTEEERLAVLEKPRLGENRLTQVRVRESKEFKNTVDKLLKRANASIIVGASTWMEQFKEALSVIGAPDDEMEEESSEDGQGRQPSCKDYILHILTVFWKVLFAFVPPTTYWNGWLCFSIAIVWIGILTAFIGDLASHFGCTIGLPDTVTAISFVALGTSIPDTFASKVAAIQDKYADASIGNVTGSNAVNVFLGIGIAWSCAAIYHTWNGGRFCVKPGNLAFSVTMFCSGAGVAILTLLLRRMKAVGGELGGPKRYKIPTAMLFMFLWLFYLFMSSMEAYGYIEGF